MKTSNSYYSSIHKLGSISTVIALLLMTAVPLGITLIYKVPLEWGIIFSAIIKLYIVFVPTQIVEVLTISPLLGAGGSYLSFITGNVLGMKLPAATAAQKSLDTKPGTDENEVVSVLAIGMSSITTTLIIVIGVFFLSPFIVYLSDPLLKPAFDNIMPALLGAMLLPLLVQSPKVAILPLLISLLFGIFISSQQMAMFQGYILIICMAISIFGNIIIDKMFNKK